MANYCDDLLRSVSKPFSCCDAALSETAFRVTGCLWVSKLFSKDRAGEMGSDGVVYLRIYARLGRIYRVDG